MKDAKTKERFIELRAQDWSFDRIASKIDVSKPTLIKWHNEFEREIANLKFAQFESLLEQFGLVKQKRVEMIAELLQKAQDELQQRELSDLSTKQLLDMMRSLRTQLADELRSVKCFTGEFESVDAEFMDLLSPEKTIRLDA